MSHPLLSRPLLLAVFLPCLCSLAQADAPAPAPVPVGQAANSSAEQGGPVRRSHGHDVRPGSNDGTAAASNGASASTNATASGNAAGNK